MAPVAACNSPNKLVIKEETESGDMLGKRSPPPTMLIKDQVQSKPHIFSAKDVTVSSATLQLNPDTMKETSKMEHSDVHTVKYAAPNNVTPKQSPHHVRSPAKSDPAVPTEQGPPVPEQSRSTQSSGDAEPKISHEETTARLRSFIKKRTVTEAFHQSQDKSSHPFQPWIPSVSNLRKASSEPNLKAKSRLRAKLTDRPSNLFTRTLNYSPRKENQLPSMNRERVPSMSEEMASSVSRNGHATGDYTSPPFKFPKIDSTIFKSLPNLPKLDADPNLMLSPDEQMKSLSFTSYYPALAKLMSSDSSSDRHKDIWRSPELWKNVRLPDPRSMSSFQTNFPSNFSNGVISPTAPEQIDFTNPKTILEYTQAQIYQMQQLAQRQDELSEQQKSLQLQQELLLSKQNMVRQQEVAIRKAFYDASTNMAVADHMVSTMLNQSHPLNTMATLQPGPDLFPAKHAEILLKKHQHEQQQLAASQQLEQEQLMLLRRTGGVAGKVNSAFGQYNSVRNIGQSEGGTLGRNIASQSAPNVQALAADSTINTVSANIEQIPNTPGTGIIYDSSMLKHICTCADPCIHKESPGRLSSIWARLMETGVASRCTRLKARKCSNEELELVHSHAHVCKYAAGLPRNKGDKPEWDDFKKLKCGGIGKDEQTVWNENYSTNAARTAAGCVLELATKVGLGEMKNGFALVRPPGHHAEHNEAIGGCYFNNVAIAAKYLTTNKISNRVLIVDWDLEHGNGLQQIFYNDPNVLVINIHRHDKGAFNSGTGHVTADGEDTGKGYNINIAFSGSDQAEFGDPEYLGAFRCIIKPVAEQFCPDIVLISAGFNSMAGHDSYNVTAECFAFMTQELGRLAEGRIVLALEGGHHLVSLSQACEMCVRSLLGEQITHLPAKSLKCAPNKFAVKAIEECMAVHRKYWQFQYYLNNISLSVLDAVKRDKEEVDTITALASLSMQHPGNSLHQIGRMSEMQRLIQNRTT